MGGIGREGGRDGGRRARRLIVCVYVLCLRSRAEGTRMGRTPFISQLKWLISLILYGGVWGFPFRFRSSRAYSFIPGIFIPAFFGITLVLK